LPTKNLYNDAEVFQTNSAQKVTTLSKVEPGEIILGILISIDPLGQPLVDFPLNPNKSPITAITTLVLKAHHVSRQVALLFNKADLSQPIVIGLIHSPLQAMLDNFQQNQESTSNIKESKQVELAANLDADNVSVDGKTITFEAKDKMVFKCGQSSITLTKEGKVLIRGKYLLNRSSGVNRIMGGSVQVN